MAHTVIGLFESDADAQRAVQRLEGVGLDRQHVDVSRGGSGNMNVSSTRDSDDDGRENGVTRFFKSLFGSDDDADRYSRVSSQEGCYIVTVHAQSADQAERAADLLDECGAINVDERAQQYRSASGTSGERSDRDFAGQRETTIPRIQEDLNVGKRTEERGGVRVRSRIVERPVEEHIRLRDEHVHVERNPVNREVTDRDRASMQDRDIELTERTEVPVVKKDSRVVEEVRISKDVTERDETVRDTLRNTEVDVDKLNPEDRRNRTDSDGRI